ncbi:MAG: hypothetical protein HYV65_00940 [Candidatus Spechtbacteria bacterium]|nr:hypothetical protein [Candidatus Spechtbacteria bacterium]
MLKSIFSIAIIAVVTAIVLFTLKGNIFLGVAKMFFSASNEVGENEEKYIKKRDLPPSKQQVPQTDTLFISELSKVTDEEQAEEKSEANAKSEKQKQKQTSLAAMNIDKNFSAAVTQVDALLKDALAHPTYEEYEVLMNIVQKYKDYEAGSVFGAVTKVYRKDAGVEYEKEIEESEGQNTINESIYALEMIDRHIFVWAPFYYYVHSNAQPLIRSTLTMLRDQHKELLRQVAQQDSLRAGKIATEYIKFLIDDIAKSGRRKNSDFIRFSYADYTNYRVFFDEQWGAYSEFRAVFAKEGMMLFDSLYTMHKDVPPEQNAEVRAMLQTMREELISLHQKAILEVAQKDRLYARSLAENTIKLLSKQLESRNGQHPEVLEFIRADMQSYDRFIAKNLR